MKIFVFVLLLRLSELNCHESSSDESNDSHHHSHHSHKHVFKEMFYWDRIDFQFPSDCTRNVSLSTGSYISGNNDILGMGVWKEKIFVSVFRQEVGVSSSFNYFLKNSTSKSPVLIPYPSYEANYVSEDPGQKTITLPSNSSIICAGYFRIDRCDRLWIIDAGFVDFFGKTRVLTPPALVIFNLNTNELIRRYTIPAEFVSLYTGFVNLDLDIDGNNCDNAHAYITDLFRSIVVYSFKQNRSWRFMHNLLGSDPRQGYFSFGNIHLNWNFGSIGITVGERHRDGSRRVYVSVFASTKTYYISNKVLQNETYIALNDYYHDVHLLGNRGKKGHMFTWAYDEKTRVLFDTQFYRKRISCWNTSDRYTNVNFGTVLQQKESFFPSDVSIDRNRNLWVMSNNLILYLNGTWKMGVKNIRIFKGKVDDIISGTVCRH